jgi:hypothetical protein
MNCLSYNNIFHFYVLEKLYTTNPLSNIVAFCFSLFFISAHAAKYTNKTTSDGLGANSVYVVYVSGSTVYAETIRGLSISINGGTNFTNKTPPMD